MNHGGGVAGVILAVGGGDIDKESQDIIRERGIVPVGHCIRTTPGKLPCKHLLHAVGPRWETDPNPKDLLSNAIENTLVLANSLGD